MNAQVEAAAPIAGDGIARVALAELIALRARVARLHLAPAASHARRAGGQASRTYGRGMDYAESRVYQAGDDVRRLDWRLTARSGRLHTKLFQEDHDAALLILLDTHASMRFGTRTRFKSVQAALAAAAAAWIAVRGGERVGIAAWGANTRWLRPQAGPRAALAVCGALAAWDAQLATPAASAPEPLSLALERAHQVLHGASRVLVISDGFSADHAARQRLLDLRRRARISLLTVADPLELAVAPPGRYPVACAGTVSLLALETERSRRDFQRDLGAGAERLAGLGAALGLAHAQIDTRADVTEAVAALLAARGGWR